ncbi:VOC family protein [Microbacterium sp.]|uniref:VOC family protein n=1 Tax=Microbacterium sp. TaxID=51671 RepID=UPI003A85361F
MSPSETPWVADPKPRDIATFGAVELDVTSLSRSVAFWTDVIGLTIRAETGDGAELGTAAQTLVILHEVAHAGFQQRHSGLYHLAVHAPTEPDFARILLRLIRANWPISPTDHIMSKAIYLLDPDGITVEITLETPERFSRFVFDDTMPYALDINGNRSSGRDRLDVRAVLETLTDDDTTRPVPDGTRIGHVHLYVGDLQAAFDYYKLFGFNEATWAPRFHMGDLGGGGAFNHRIAVNTWQGIGAPPSPEGTARMRNFTIRFDTHELLDHALGNLGPLTETPDGYLTRDPSGNSILLPHV